MVRAFTRLFPVPWPRGALPMVATDVRWERGDDPLPLLRLIIHWQIVGGGPSYLPVNDEGRIRFRA